MKNKTLKLALIIFAGIIAFLGCKKGEDDPFLSLKSRDARITGIWKLTKQEYTRIEYNGTTDTETTTRNFDGNLMTVTTPNDTNTYSFSYEIIIEKDGTYIMTTIEDGDKNELKGNWWWLDDKKSKTRIAFGDDYDSYEIVQLKNKELILTTNYSDIDTDSDGEMDGETETLKMTFTQK